MSSILLATRNAHKVREFERLLPGVAIAPLPDSAPTPEETGTTYAENALIKARSAAQATGEPSFADDSGIEAEALDWRPGVYTARFAGPDASDGENLAKLHREAPAGSRARYVCVIAYVSPDGSEELFDGTCEGTLAEQPAGGGGFGYDPLFVPAEFPDRTMAELTDEQKDLISHRGRAARAFAAWLSGRGA